MALESSLYHSSYNFLLGEELYFVGTTISFKIIKLVLVSMCAKL